MTTGFIQHMLTGFIPYCGVIQNVYIITNCGRVRHATMPQTPDTVPSDYTDSGLISQVSFLQHTCAVGVKQRLNRYNVFGRIEPQAIKTVI